MADSAAVARLGRLDERLSEAPYDGRAIVERLLLLSVVGKQTEALRSFDEMCPYLGPCFGTAVLHDVVTGRLRIQFKGKSYVLGSETISVEAIARAEAIACHVSTSLARSVRSVLAFLISDGGRAPFAVRFFNGLGIISVNKEDIELPFQSGLLAHEVTHVILSSGQPFLDEGLATYFELEHASGQAAGNYISADRLPSLRALLGPNVRLVHQALAQRDGLQNVYNYGAAMVRWLLAERGPTPLCRLMEGSVLSLSHGNFSEDFERTLDVEIDALDDLLHEEFVCHE